MSCILLLEVNRETTSHNSTIHQRVTLYSDIEHAKADLENQLTIFQVRCRELAHASHDLNIAHIDALFGYNFQRMDRWATVTKKYLTLSIRILEIEN